MSKDTKELVLKGLKHSLNVVSASLMPTAERVDCIIAINNSINFITALKNARDDVLEEAAKVAATACLVPPDGGSPTRDEVALCDEAAKRIRALKSTTQPAAQVCEHVWAIHEDKWECTFCGVNREIDKPTLAPISTEFDGWQYTGAEKQSKSGRIKWAEGLILQLPANHDGRNSWLLNYGVGGEAQKLRADRGIVFDHAFRAAETIPPSKPTPPAQPTGETLVEDFAQAFAERFLGIPEIDDWAAHPDPSIADTRGAILWLVRRIGGVK